MLKETIFLNDIQEMVATEDIPVFKKLNRDLTSTVDNLDSMVDEEAPLTPIQEERMKANIPFLIGIQEMLATKDLPVFRHLNEDCISTVDNLDFRVDEEAPYLGLLSPIQNEIRIGYTSQRAPEPGYYRFVIPKGSRYYYTTNYSLLYVSDRIKLVSDKPLTEKECIKICNFPKSYEEACKRLGWEPLTETKFRESKLCRYTTLSTLQIETVTTCINRQYGIEKYDWGNPNQFKWYGWYSNHHLEFMGANYRTAKRVESLPDTFFDYRPLVDNPYMYSECSNFGGTRMHCTNEMWLPFKFAVEYVYLINPKFYDLWKSYFR
jgi:hypothetical protein